MRETNEHEKDPDTDHSSISGTCQAADEMPRACEGADDETDTAVVGKSGQKTPRPPAKRRRWPKRLAWALVVVLAACAVGFGAYVSDYYHAEDTPSLLSNAEAVSVEEDDGIIAIAPIDVLAGDAPIGAGVILYPGAKVDPHAYVPLAEKLAARGYLCVIAKMPFNLAFFGIDAASAIMERYSQTRSWWIAGHSLGGVAAADYAARHADAFDGIAFLASYPASDLSASGLHALSAYGSNDFVLNRESLAENQANLPADTQTLVIEGGNHAGFGAYGPQAGDGEASISADEQQEIFVDALDELIEGAQPIAALQRTEPKRQGGPAA